MTSLQYLTSNQSSSGSNSKAIIEIDGVDDENKIALFQIVSQVVGKRYYDGHMNDNETVFLIREPQNPYDRNAIVVRNILNEQVGHICAKDGTASILAPIADYSLQQKAGGDLEAVVVNGAHAVYSSTVKINIVGDLRNQHIIQQHLEKHRVPYKNLMTGDTKNGYSYRETTKKASKAAHPTNYRILSQDEVIKQLDTIWEDQDSAIENLKLSQFHADNLRSCLLTELYPHQIQGIAWMITKENDTTSLPPFFEERVVHGKLRYFNSLVCHDYEVKPKSYSGGLLCDDMGLGKSLMMLGVIAGNRTTALKFRQELSDRISLNDENSKSKVKRSSNSSTKSNSFQSESLEIVDLCSDTESASTTQVDRTLIICPLSVISSWQDQISSHIKPGYVSVLQYQGSNRAKSTRELLSHDIILTTYNVVSIEFDQNDNPATGKKRKTSSLLHQLDWTRIVLDEGHIIRNMKTTMFKAINALRGTKRWVLSGTPIQNTVADLHAPIQFIRLEPFTKFPEFFNRFFTREIKTGDPVAIAKFSSLIKLISLRRVKNKVIADQLPTKIEIIVNVDLTPNEREAYDSISAAIKEFMVYLESLDPGTGNEVMRNSQSILGFITRLRQCCNDFSLVPAESLVKLLSFYNSKNSSISTTASNSNMVSRLTDEVKMELLAKFDALFSKASGVISNDPLNSSLQNEESVLECCICFDVLNEEKTSIFKGCEHTFCDVCMHKLFRSAGNSTCPMCRQPVKESDIIAYNDLKMHAEKIKDITQNTASTIDITKDSLSEDSSKIRSSKTNEIVAAVMNILSNNSNEKVVIFSSFVTYLQILETEFQQSGIRNCKITGSMTQTQRSQEIQKFTKDDDFPLMLCSLKAAGVGITLTRANHIFLADLWWSPAADLQAIDRVHRLGQTRQVHVYRFIVKDSIDEKIYGLQKEKIALSALMFESNANKVREDRLNNFRELLT